MVIYERQKEIYNREFEIRKWIGLHTNRDCKILLTLVQSLVVELIYFSNDSKKNY